MAVDEQWLIDLDGVMWLGTAPIGGSAHALDRLRATGRRVAFFTNNSFSTKQQLLDKMSSLSITCTADELLSSAQAAARLCQVGERALVVGGPGIVESLDAHGVSTFTPEQYAADLPIDVVVVGFDPAFDFTRLTAAVRALFGGARLVGTNEDATYPMADGPVPGAGSMLHAISFSSGQTPQIAGKPNQPAVELIGERIGHVDIAVGDRLSTDGVLAAKLDARFAHVHSGVDAAKSEHPEVHVDLEAANLRELVDEALAGDANDRSMGPPASK